jgi:hypothetical protein
MTLTGYQTPNFKIVMGGQPLVQRLEVETATNMYPGRLVIKGTNDSDITVADGVSSPLGWLGYEQPGDNPPDNITSLYSVGAEAPVLSGAGRLLQMPLGLAAKTTAVKSDVLLSWGDGQVVPGAWLGGRLGVRIPFSKSTDEVSTVTLPAGAVVRDVIIKAVTVAAGATIDVGTLSSASGDADGFLEGESLVTAGFVPHNNYDAVAANNTSGALLVESDITGDVAAGYYSIPTGYLVPAGGKILTYTTSDHTVAGYIFVVIESPGIAPVGICEKSVSAASTSADVQVRTLI